MEAAKKFYVGGYNHFAGWRLQSVLVWRGSICRGWLQTIERVEAANNLQGEGCNHFASLMQQ